jgi:multidrug efflux pump subunit AcrA (membrane-fusion protein)
MKRTTLFFLSLAALVQYGCGGSHEPRTTEAAAMPPVAVKVVEVRSTEWPSMYEAIGTVRARTAATLASKVMGYVREVNVQPGDQVSSGQVLVSIDARDLEAGLLQARAAAEEARSGIAEAENGIAAAKAQLNLAQVTFRRMEDLFRKTSISHQEFDEAQARLQSAEAAYQMAASKRAQLDARIAQAKQGVESASVMRSYAEIRAPFAGIVTEKQIESGQMATPGTPLLTVEQTGAYRLEAQVEESMLGSVKIGQNVSVTLDASGQTVNARISEIVPAIDPQSRAFLVKASLPSSTGIRSGIFGRMRIPRGSHQAIAIPEGAVIHRGGLQSVFVVENGVAHTRLVTTGQTHERQAEVLSGLNEGERIVHPRPANVTDGVKVEVR